MRQACKEQLALTEPWLDMERARELAAISRLLDQDPRINDLVSQCLGGEADEDAEPGDGGGLSAEQVLWALILKQMGGYGYRELAFHLADSSTYRTFCRIGIGEESPSKSSLFSLASHIKAVRAETLEGLNRVLVGAAQRAGIENGRKVRVDCTVVESNIHQPTDSSLLWDCVRKLTELMGAPELEGKLYPPPPTPEAQVRFPAARRPPRTPPTRTAADPLLTCKNHPGCAILLPNQLPLSVGTHNGRDARTCTEAHSTPWPWASPRLRAPSSAPPPRLSMLPRTDSFSETHKPDR